MLARRCPTVISSLPSMVAVSRRHFLRSTAFGALALTGLEGRSAPARGGKLDCIFFDVRRAEALVFGDAAGRLGAKTQGISGDVDDLCYEQLSRRWRVGTAPVAGMTDLRILFLLQVMAADAGLRTVLCVHHRDSNGWVPDLRWCSAAAQLVMTIAARVPDAVCCDADSSAENLPRGDSRTLATWLIA